MLGPSVTINVWSFAFITSAVSYLFRSSLTNRNKAEKKHAQEDLPHNPAFAPSLHAC